MSGVMGLPTQEQSSHDLFLIITTALLILFAASRSASAPVSEPPIILP
jgi:hypothetical protein